jgi:hypothetical protein
MRKRLTRWLICRDNWWTTPPPPPPPPTANPEGPIYHCHRCDRRIGF